MVAPGYTLDPGSVFDEYVSKEGEMTTVALQVLLEEPFEVPLSMTETASVRYYTMTFWYHKGHIYHILGPLLWKGGGEGETRRQRRRPSSPRGRGGKGVRGGGEGRLVIHVTSKI